MAKSGVVILFLLSVLHFNALAQKQLIVLRKGVAVARFVEGGKFKGVLKNHQKKEGTIVELNEFSMVTTEDTIAFQSIAKISRKNYFRVNIMRDVGGILFYGGLLFYGAVKLNDALGYDKSDNDQAEHIALVAAAAGAVILFAKSPYRRVGNRMTMRTIDYTSPYYTQPLN